MPFSIRPSRRFSVQFNVFMFFVLCMIAATSGFAAKDGRPFWTEKSSFIEGDELFVVGVASNSKTVEEARKQAFENGMLELMNFAQVTSLEARGLVIETQMTFEEPQANGTVTVYRLLRVPIEKLRAIQDNLRTQTVVQEHALEKAQRDLQGVQQSLARKQQLLDGQSRQTQETLDSVSKLQETLGLKSIKIEQKQREVEQLLQQLSGKVKQTEPAPSPPRVAGTTTMKPNANTAPLYQRLQETEVQLDAQEAQLRELAVRAKERLASENETAKAYQRKCKFIAKGMTRDEVREILGESHQVVSYKKTDSFLTIYKFMDSKGQSHEVMVGFAFNSLVESLVGCKGNEFHGF
jgi:hypothetical protein